MALEIGMTGRSETVVTEENTAKKLGSGLLPVFATPMMTLLMENAASELCLPHLAEGEGTVGTHLDISHDSATPIGMKVWAEAKLTAIDGRALTFEVTAYDEKGPIGKGTHQRFIIKNERFMEKAEAKKGN
ncbi:MAG: thioesterase family protein [Eubacteriales bacterium]|nr:thioesterase family protein [Eubacteriales bacterium]